SIEACKEALDVGVGRLERSLVEPERVRGADGFGTVVGLRERERNFLVRDGDVGADIAVIGEMRHELREFFRRHAFAPVLAGETMLPDPIIMDQRRARMRRRPADDAGFACRRHYFSAATTFFSVPICGT